MGFGRSPSGRAMRCNVGFVASPHISTAIPNAENLMPEFQFFARSRNSNIISYFSFMAILECVPNFSEGRDHNFVRHLAQVIESVSGVQLLHTDSGAAANRSVFTFAGAPAAVVEAAFRGIKTAAEFIDMRFQKGEHPRIGATDVCPLIPVSGLTMEEADMWAKKLGKRVASELGIPVYFYEYSATQPMRKRLENIRKGGYEGLEEKMKTADWQPDCGSIFNAQSGATVVGARDFLIAYNITLNSRDVEIAQRIAAEIRESGARVVNEKGEKIRRNGQFKSVKAIGWFIEEFDKVQVSINLTQMQIAPLHEVFEAVVARARAYGVTVSGSELIGLIPQQVLVEAGAYFFRKENKQIPQLTDNALLCIEKAVEVLGLSEIRAFNPKERILEFRLQQPTQRVDVFSK
jgi:glutamate formiminotransferase / formiminotetrahydrofolate cyclodeaminase